VDPAPVEAPPGGDARTKDLTRIEADRQAVEAEMARMVEAMRRAREALAGAAPGPFVPGPHPSAATSPLPGAPRETRVALATLERVDGEVFLIDAVGARTRAASSRPLEAGQGVAVGAGASRAAVAFADGTRLELAADTELSRIDDGPAGKRLRVERGRLAVEAARQPAGKTLVFETPHAEARVVGTAFTLEVHPESTALAVREGRVRLVRRADGAAVDVGAGQHAAAAPGAGLGPFRSTPFVLGVNFNGEAVSVEGRRWSSYREALAAGLRVTPEPACTSTGVLPSPAVDEATGAMLNTAVFGRERSLALAQPLPNGAYDVFLWVMENLDNDHRTFDVVVEGKSRLRNIGTGMKRGEWVRLGPVRAVVADGALDVELVAKRTDPHLMGMAVYRADPR
jgi:ferric-dicitrate binding protein FerR (iron transport regulator)